MKNLLVFLLSICLISNNLTLVKAEDQGLSLIHIYRFDAEPCRLQRDVESGEGSRRGAAPQGDLARLQVRQSDRYAEYLQSCQQDGKMSDIPGPVSYTHLTAEPADAAES